MIPTIVNSIMQDYSDLLQEQLPSCIEGIYLHGSVALNSFDDSSDIDFITVINRCLKKEEIYALGEIHQFIAAKYRKPEMDGMYVQQMDIGKNNENSPTPFYNGGEMHPTNAFNLNPITWWTLKYHGIRVIGRSIEALKIEVTEEDLVQYVDKNMNSYWKNRVEMIGNIDFTTIPDDLVDQEIEWSILGVLRQYYTINEQKIISKAGAGKYALTKLPSKWSNIIQEAIRIREKVGETYYPNREEKIADSLSFLTFLMDRCNALLMERDVVL
ncbi:nucleotidyltransferase domain-containing protein [Bacillus sp. FJAT-49736]|uniref:nucleotidyltransferase domain-containing protein n=1 Tax=Bacillus sp. FJAT-49736 TaxID=2833582 RepID=UPI001BC8DDF4|nr:nucleotidyltransferase domain-containing protein [Bacillus sp. FJAT-49736]MBS4174942.1 DUF4111 domain-containing protein [Bacillus sp. FJAT-49736]